MVINVRAQVENVHKLYVISLRKASTDIFMNEIYFKRKSPCLYFTSHDHILLPMLIFYLQISLPLIYFT